MKKKVHPAESAFYRKLGKKSAAARRKKILERAKVEPPVDAIGNFDTTGKKSK